MATSRQRSDARASSRFETFTDATSSTPIPTPSIVVMRIRIRRPNTRSMNRTTLTPRRLLVFG